MKYVYLNRYSINKPALELIATFSSAFQSFNAFEIKRDNSVSSNSLTTSIFNFFPIFKFDGGIVDSHLFFKIFFDKTFKLVYFNYDKEMTDYSPTLKFYFFFFFELS